MILLLARLPPSIVPPTVPLPVKANVFVPAVLPVRFPKPLKVAFPTPPPFALLIVQVVALDGPSRVLLLPLPTKLFMPLNVPPIPLAVLLLKLTVGVRALIFNVALPVPAKLPMMLPVGVKVKVLLVPLHRLPKPEKFMEPLLPALTPEIVVLPNPLSVLIAVDVVSLPMRSFTPEIVPPINEGVPVKLTVTGVVKFATLNVSLPLPVTFPPIVAPLEKR